MLDNIALSFSTFMCGSILLCIHLHDARANF